MLEIEISFGLVVVEINMRVKIGGLIRFAFLPSINPERQQIQAIHLRWKRDPFKLRLLSEIPVGNIFSGIKYDSKIFWKIRFKQRHSSNVGNSRIAAEAESKK